MTLERKVIKGDIQITRGSDDLVRIRLTDGASRVGFATVELSLAEFGSLITGMGLQDVKVTTTGLDVVGKTKVVEPRLIECPLATYDRIELEAWLAEHGKEEGWTVDPYLGSQKSIGYRTRHGAPLTLRYSVFKYV